MVERSEREGRVSIDIEEDKNGLRLTCFSEDSDFQASKTCQNKYDSNLEPLIQRD